MSATTHTAARAQHSFHFLHTGHELPEYLQRAERARQSNIAMAQRRLLDRETYRGLRQYIRCPVDAVERARNVRWSRLRTDLFVHRWKKMPAGVSMHEAMRRCGLVEVQAVGSAS